MQEVTVCGTDPVLSFSLAGEIDAGNSEDFFNEVMSLYERAPRDVVFECARLAFIDSTTLGTFVKISNRAKADGHKLTLTALRPRLKKLFTISALDRTMEIAE